MLAAAGVYLALPEPLSVGPSWLLLAIIVLLMIPIVVSDRRGNHNVTRTLTFIANGIITIAMVAALIHLIQGIPHHLETPQGAAAFRGRAVDREYFGVRAVVLEAGCGRSAAARSWARNVSKFVFIPADVEPGRA